ncbi:hypothetical protein BM221_008516 [Beauveria bassiana]|uniref:Uncharacterized protein n=1 Tax=Beauveria bassiana TaxID=176275 RepID=A0A2N6ND05_BEABA|nr:hypothetical protein BM221_008516 [Beauveria bassiana]
MAKLASHGNCGWLRRTVLRDQGDANRGISDLDTMTDRMHRQDGDREELGILDHRLRRDAHLPSPSGSSSNTPSRRETLLPASYRKESSDLAAAGLNVTALCRRGARPEVT